MLVYHDTPLVYFCSIDPKRFEDAGVTGKDFDLLNNYMLALHSLDRDAQGKPVFDQSLTAEQRQAFISDVQSNHPEVARAEEAFQAFRNDFLQSFMVDTGYMTQEQLELFNRLYPHYVPTYRVKDGKGENGAGGKRYSIRRAKGSTETIYNPLDSFVQMVDSIVSMVSNNNAALVWDNVYHEYDGMGLFGREVTQDMSKDTVNTEGLQQAVQSILEDEATGGDVIQRVLEAIGKEQSQWHGTGDVALPNVLSVQRPDGARAYYEIFDPELYKSLAGTTESASRGILRFAGRATKAMSALTTGSNPVFAIRNFMRDFQKSVTYGSWASNYASGTAKWLRSAWDVFREGGEYVDYKALGGGGWNRIEAGKKRGAEDYRGALFKGYNRSNAGRRAKWMGKKLWNTLTFSRLNEIVEQASRYAEYRYGKQDRSTPEGKQKAFLNAQEATVDFSRTGSSRAAAELKQLIPFFGASVQGIYQTGREYTSKAERSRLPQRFAKTVINTALASALASVWLLRNLDDDAKEEFAMLSDDLKADNLYIPNIAPWLFGEEPLIRIPLGQDPLMRAVHGVVTNAIWSGQGDEPIIELTAIVQNLLDGFNPVNGTIFDAAIAMSTNKTWYGSPIVPRRMDGRDPTIQYTEETPDFFIALSRGLDVMGVKASPMKLEYFMQQYTGFLGQMIIPAISKDKSTGEMVGLDGAIAAARKRLTSDPLVSNGIVSTFYDGDTLLNQIGAAAKDELEQNQLRRGLTPGEATAAVDEAYALTHTGGIVYETKKMISATYDEIDQINANTELSEHEKYLLTSQKRREMLEGVLDAQEVIGEYRGKYVDGENPVYRFLKGPEAGYSTAYEKLPEVFRNDRDAGEGYMSRAYEVWEATGSDSVLPSVKYTFSLNKANYEVEEAYQEGFTQAYRDAYRKYVRTEGGRVNWDKLSADDQVEFFRKARTNANNAAKKWYVRQGFGPVEKED